ncbi:hypothetical protein Kpol_2002p104 [Vanderwaltozyma polyspora DSM 70294]|uniref:PH domain-containing protein n=1 Tax=Vanderwaltozyma polyspora (strain ATCC 22028 / DSM 70294 / BCRC 21397 / CBS 2163 / NBRC 10782 / NRRL Y-8283 / UCD 57-17) TaxID=436907 RepID=A7TFL8_VANPO|nr:uncharacterized protein Kpol_2002p104 [Vanderwaltozyma polyspora DSM 70294]EDO19032.1 hypothetical protein Kpol_2002p104 [Vanderwaltozyma polyspora DSM 70294]
MSDTKIEDSSNDNTSEVNSKEQLMVLLTVETNELNEKDSKLVYNLLTSSDCNIEISDFIGLFQKFNHVCNHKVFCDEVIISRVYWNKFKEILLNSSPETVTDLVSQILEMSLTNYENHLESFEPMLQAIYDEHILFHLIDYSVVETASPALLSSVLVATSNIFECCAILANYDYKIGIVLVLKILFYYFDLNGHELISAIFESKKLDDHILKKTAGCFSGIITVLRKFKINSFPNSYKRRFFLAVFDMMGEKSVTIEDFESDLKYEDLGNLNFLQAFDLILFLESNNLSFKKTLTEQLIFGQDPFPLTKAIVYMSNALAIFIDPILRDSNTNTELMSVVIMKNTILYAFMDNLLKMWVESNAKSESDLYSLLDLVKIIMYKAEIHIRNRAHHPNSRLVHYCEKFINSVDYKTARQWQINVIKNSQCEEWADSLKEFNEMLSTQVFDYVRHLRVLQLQTGSWYYNENPLSVSVKNRNISFVMLSDNQKHILVRDFDFKTTDKPYIVDNKIISGSTDPLSPNSGTRIPSSKTLLVSLNDIESIENEEITPTNTISDTKTPKNVILKKNVCMKVDILGKQNKLLLRLYFDNRESRYIWLDGLKLILHMSKKKNNETDVIRQLSNDTREQIEKLIEVRRNTQMINLFTDSYSDISDKTSIEEIMKRRTTVSEENIKKEKNILIDATTSEEDSDDEQYYNMDTLKSLPANLFYD